MLLAATLALLALAPPARAQDAALHGAWRAWLVVDEAGRELPFGVEIGAAEDGTLSAFLLNDPERIAVPLVAWDGTTLTLALPHYDSRIEAHLEGEELVGTWEKVRGKDKLAIVPFRARRGDLPRFPAGEGARVDVTGRWTVDFLSDELPAVGVFEQAGTALTGTFLTATGDYRYLAGSVDGNRLRLSCFDGAHAFLFEATLDPDGTLQGDFCSGDWWHETWTAVRAPEAELGDAFGQTTWDEDVSVVDLVFPDLKGELVALADLALTGRAAIVQIFGSWCPNCHDETAYLVELHRRYRERGLRVVGLAFELTGEFERDRQQVEVFRERHGIEYPILLAGTADKLQATLAFGAVDRIRSFPTTIFLHGDGRVRAVHSGFAGPATGAEHGRLRVSYEATIEELLEESLSGGETWSVLAAAPWFSGTGTGRTTLTFEHGPAGARRARMVRQGRGGRNAQELTPSVRTSGDAVWIGERLWRLDRQAGVLRDPVRFGARWAPEGSSSTPLLDERGIGSDEEAAAKLETDDPVLRREIYFRFGIATDLDPGVQDVIVRGLADPDPGVRLAAAWAAGRQGVEEAIEPMFAALDDPHTMLRITNARALLRMATSHPEALEKLQPALHDPVQEIREAVMDAFRMDPGAYDE